MAILSIQSRVSYGYVGNSIAVPAIQAAGLEVWPLDTVSFSNHPGHGHFRGEIRPAAEVQAHIDGLAALGVPDTLSAILSGYLGLPETAGVVAGAVDKARAVNPAIPFVLDPVIGDNGRRFVRDGVAEAICGELLPRADIVTPNLYELGVLCGSEVSADTGAITAAARTLIADARLSAVAITGIERPGTVSNMLVLEQTCYEATAPRLDRGFNGTGDLFAALLTAWLVRTGDVRSAFARAAGGLETATRITDRSGRMELDLPAILKSLKRLCPAALKEVPAPLGKV
ncbi:pyridoxal kinase [uncultured Nisaea sp.]|uniref:pyridoxal kinase n=1 Tax=uncultured Nisaea sp. TaxID=538215 RepID=UPI0030EF7304|tara:strand:+ start:144 stop:1001 length:858 start_codon:yes stop_codon:yes gene_type:complete